MALHGTQATFDPLSAMGDDDGQFSTVFDSDDPPPPPAAAAAAAPPQASPQRPAAAAAYMPPPEYNSFMTARSNMSYMSATSASQPGHRISNSGGGGSGGGGIGIAAAPPPSGPFRRLPDRSPGGGGGGAAIGDSNPFAPAAAPLPQAVEYDNPFAPSPAPLAADDSNPFATGPPLHGAQQQQAHGYAGFTGGAAGPLSFGGGGAAGALADSAAFDMPADLYDTPDAPPSVAPPLAAAAVHPPPPPRLQPLQGFTREFSAALPVSQDPTSPPVITPAATMSGPLAYGAGGGGAGAGVSADNPFAPGGSATAGSSGAGPSRISGGGGGTLVAGGYSAASLLTNTVSVHSPRKAVGPSRIPGLSEPYVLYRVTSRGAGCPEASVERRFRDVVALAEALAALYPGCFVPPRPSRAAIEGRRMQAGFIEERRQGIEKFLRRLVVHPVLGPSDVTQVWLRTPAPDLRSCPEWLRLLPAGPPGLARSTARLLAQVVGREGTVPSPLEAAQPAAAAGDVYRLLHERAAAARGVTSRMQPPPLEERLKQEGAALQERFESLVTLSRRADSLLTRGSKFASVLGCLAEALRGVAEADATAAAAGAAAATAAPSLRVAAECCNKVGKLAGVATDASAKHLSPLNDWLAAAPGATAALAARERCLLSAATLAADEVAARVRAAEAAGRAGSSPAAAKKAESLREQVAALGAAAAAARDEYERVGGRNETELAAFKAHMSRELADCVHEFALVQAAAAQKAAAAWQEAAEQLAALAAGGGGLGGGGGVGFGAYGSGDLGVAAGH